MEPDCPSDDEETKEEGAAEDEKTTMNFMTRLYEDENFVREKTALEE